MSKKSHEKNGKNKRCIYSNKITEGKEVILVDEVLNYIFSLGWMVKRTNGKEK